MWKKSFFDYTLSLILLLPLLLVVVVLIIIATINTKQFGLFTHERIGKHGVPFKLYKIRTMTGANESSITTSKSHHITKIGKQIRKLKLDELPQVINILQGNMSFVGPRPDVKGYADKLKGDDRIMLTVKPGITGPAQIKYKNEEEILANQNNPKQYNDEVIWPDKVKINKEYIKKWSLKSDLNYILKTIF